jgi:hypothetical protein
VTVGFSPQTGQFGSLRSFISAEAHPEGIVEQQASDKGFPDPEYELDGLGRLDGAYRAREDPRTPPSAQLGTRPGGGGSG